MTKYTFKRDKTDSSLAEVKEGQCDWVNTKSSELHKTKTRRSIHHLLPLSILMSNFTLSDIHGKPNNSWGRLGVLPPELPSTVSVAVSHSCDFDVPISNKLIKMLSIQIPWEDKKYEDHTSAQYADFMEYLALEGPPKSGSAHPSLNRWGPGNWSICPRTPSWSWAKAQLRFRSLTAAAMPFSLYRGQESTGQQTRPTRWGCVHGFFSLQPHTHKCKEHPCSNSFQRYTF